MFLLHPNLGCGSHFSMELPNSKTNVSIFQLPSFKASSTKLLMGLLLILGISLFQTTVLAQNATKPVTGKVLGANNQPLEVTISQKGATKMTLTDKDGKFSIVVPSNATLLFSYVGYTAKQEAVNNRTEINLSLVQENAVPDEVVVIGYQTIKRKNLLASVSSVSAKDLKDIPVNSAAEALNGRLAGVTATTAEGSPDADVRVRIRGGMSITGDNSPLYIVDGVQVENGLSALAPQNIQTIDVLKDAAATAIYGARGANGVIVITTKVEDKAK